MNIAQTEHTHKQLTNGFLPQNTLYLSRTDLRTPQVGLWVFFFHTWNTSLHWYSGWARWNGGTLAKAAWKLVLQSAEGQLLAVWTVTCYGQKHFFPYTSLPFIFSNLLYHIHAYNIFLFFPWKKKQTLEVHWDITYFHQSECHNYEDLTKMCY